MIDGAIKRQEYISMLLRSGLRGILLFSMLAISSISTLAQVGKLLPVDEGVRDPSFFVFRARLLEACERRDAAFVLSAVDQNIKNGFGGDDGVAGFKRQWKSESPASELWKTLTGVLALVYAAGCHDTSAR